MTGLRQRAVTLLALAGLALSVQLAVPLAHAHVSAAPAGGHTIDAACSLCAQSGQLRALAPDPGAFAAAPDDALRVAPVPVLLHALRAQLSKSAAPRAPPQIS